MATILAYTSPAVGHIAPLMPVLMELRARGHLVHVRTLPRMVDAVRAAGIEAEPLDDRLEPIRDKYREWEARNQTEALRINDEIFTERSSIDGPDLERAIGDTDPDVLIVDINAWGALTAAAAQHRPWVQFCPYIPPVNSRGTPPFGPGLTPLSGPLGRLRDTVVGALVNGTVDKLLVPPINLLRAEYGLPAVKDAREFYFSAPRTIVATAEPFDYPHPDWPETVRRVGPLSWEPAAEPPAWLDALPDPVTLVTTSSEYQADESLARIAIEALAEDPGSLIVTVPSGTLDAKRLPPNVRVETWVPHSRVIDRAAVVVTHGGMGSTQKALAAGVPVCVVPFGRDQFETAARVVHAKAGTKLPARKLTPQRLRAAVAEAATKKPGAERVARGYAAAGGASTAADVIEELLTIDA